MRILYIMPELPVPATSGLLRHYQFLRGLREKHEISFMSLTRRSSIADADRNELEWLARDVSVYGLRPEATRDGTWRSRIKSAVRTRKAVGEMAQAVKTRLSREHFDLVFLSGKDVAPLLNSVNGVPVIADCCDAAQVRLATQFKQADWRSRPMAFARWLRIKLLEDQLVYRTPKVIFATERDRDAFDLPQSATAVVPQGVDLEYWRNDAPPVVDPVVVFTGVMCYPPNDDAARSLVRDIAPAVRRQIHDLRVVIAGRDPSPELCRQATESYVTVTGSVPDLRPYLKSAAVMVAPLRFASGIQNKVLEAMAMSLPVVTTRQVAEGLMEGGRSAPVIIANDVSAIAEETASLLREPSRRKHLGMEGRRYVEAHFGWPARIAALEQLMQSAAGRQ